MRDAITRSSAAATRAAPPYARAGGRAGTSRRRSLRAAAGATGTVCAAAVLAGCGVTGGGVVDGGVAPSLTAPTSSSPLWPDHKPPAGAEESQPEKPYPPVDGVSVPPGGLRKVPHEELLLRDRAMPSAVRSAPKSCPGVRCGMRDPVYRDLTGDRAEELILAVDDPATATTFVVVYRATGRTVRPILLSYGQLGTMGETFGRELVLTSSTGSSSYTTRYRWNGTAMEAWIPGGAVPSGSDGSTLTPDGSTLTPDVGTLGPDDGRPRASRAERPTTEERGAAR